MRRRIGLTGLCLVLLYGSAGGQGAPATDLPPEFGRRALEHVAILAGLGPRAAGSAAERDAAAWIRGRFRALGLDVRVETVPFETFVIRDATLSVGAAKASPRMIGLNPYAGELSIEGPPLFVPPDDSGDDLARLDLADRLVITADPAPYFALMFCGPRAIVYLDPAEYTALAARPGSTAALRIVGNAARRSSLNVVAGIGAEGPGVSEIVISAHYDSNPRSPGADDNASGVGVLLELARYFGSRGVDPGLRVTFVAFGAEELGLLGSRAYLEAHQGELERCVLFINLDQVGGPQGPYVEMTGGVSAALSGPVTDRFPPDLRNRAWEASDGRWRLIDRRVVDLVMLSNQPEWLVDLITRSAAAAGCQVVPTGNLGSDQLVFTQAGIVATGIGTSGNISHGPGDVPGQVRVDQLTAVGRLTARMTLEAMQRFGK